MRNRKEWLAYRKVVSVMNQLLHLIVTDGHQKKVDHTPASFSPAKGCMPSLRSMVIIVLGLVVKYYNCNVWIDHFLL